MINSSDKLRSESCPLAYDLGWNVFPPKVTCWSQGVEPQNLTAFGDSVFRKVLKVKWGHMGGALTQHDWHPSRKRRLGADSEGRRPSTCQGERPEKQPGLLTPGASRLQVCENVSRCCLGHWGCGRSGYRSPGNGVPTGQSTRGGLARCLWQSQSVTDQPWFLLSGLNP